MKQNFGETLSVSRETWERLTIYAARLLKWNRVINLVSRSTEADLYHRHFEDALQLTAFLPKKAQRGIDLGSGAGFPGLVLSIATGMSFVLIEADRRKAAFLQEVAHVTHAPAEVMPARIEEVDIVPADVLTARALAPLPQLLRYGERLLKPGGVALFLKGKNAKREIDEAGGEWNMQVELHKSVVDPSGVVLELTGLSRARA